MSESNEVYAIYGETVREYLKECSYPRWGGTPDDCKTFLTMSEVLSFIGGGKDLGPIEIHALKDGDPSEVPLAEALRSNLPLVHKFTLGYGPTEYYSSAAGSGSSGEVGLRFAQRCKNLAEVEALIRKAERAHKLSSSTIVGVCSKGLVFARVVE